MYLLVQFVTASYGFNVVATRGQQGMKVASFFSDHSHSSIKHDNCSSDRLSIAVSHYSVHPFVDLEDQTRELRYSEMKMVGKICQCHCRMCVLLQPTCSAEASCSQPTALPAGQQEGTNSSQCTQ